MVVVLLGLLVQQQTEGLLRLEDGLSPVLVSRQVQSVHLLLGEYLVPGLHGSSEDFCDVPLVSEAVSSNIGAVNVQEEPRGNNQDKKH